jgi:hypothetical protein
MIPALETGMPLSDRLGNYSGAAFAALLAARFAKRPGLGIRA